VTHPAYLLQKATVIHNMRKANLTLVKQVSPLQLSLRHRIQRHPPQVLTPLKTLKDLKIVKGYMYYNLIL
jgi:hypothetical protein